jgi:hypothetical protein
VYRFEPAGHKNCSFPSLPISRQIGSLSTTIASTIAAQSLSRRLAVEHHLGVGIDTAVESALLIDPHCGLQMPSATIRLFLPHGDPKRLRTAEISNWTGKAVAGPRADLESILARDEAENSGVYFLTGTDLESGKGAVYIGEAELVRQRIKGHLDKDFWNALIFVISKDENLTNAHIRYLEGRLIDQAKEAGRSLVLNGQCSGSKLPESDREDMEVFLDRIHQLMPVLGADFLVPIASPNRESGKSPVLLCEIKGIVARGM